MSKCALPPSGHTDDAFLDISKWSAQRFGDHWEVHFYRSLDHDGRSYMRLDETVLAQDGTIGDGKPICGFELVAH